MSTACKFKSFKLYGFPVAHSAAPTLHNAVFSSLGEEKYYEIYSTSKVTQEVIDDIHSDEFGGCAVTMPIKTAIIPYLDALTPEASSTGAVNTIVKVPILSSSSASYKLIGTNTDILGVKNALLSALRSQHPNISISSQSRYSRCAQVAGAVIGGGATTRSAAHALWMMGFETIYLVNRDVGEVEAVQAALPHIPRLIHLSHPDQVESALASSGSPRILMIVGAIPAFAPITPAERMVYTTVSSILTIPYDRSGIEDDIRKAGIKETREGSFLPLPTKRLFLEMPYKPRITPMLQVATAHGWHPIVGIEAMIEQGFAQQRMWMRGDASVEVGSDATLLGEKIERDARLLVERMNDIAVTSTEIDRATGKEAALLSVKNINM